MKLSIDERLFSYYMYRACLPFNRIQRNQNHRYTNDIIELFEYLYNKKNMLHSEFAKEMETYLVYLWSNHGFYFLRESSNNKRTPGRLGFTRLTQNELITVLTQLNYTKKYDHLLPYIFDDSVDAEWVDHNDLAKSGNNYYGKGFTEKDYEQLDVNIKNKINAYPTIENGRIVVKVRKIGDDADSISSTELSVSVYWLRKAFELSKNRKYFDDHTSNSLDLLIKYFQDGDENHFREHTKEWLKTNNKLDYVLGFVETYDDPKQIRGHAGGEITIKTMDTQKYNKLLLECEKSLPIPDEYKKNISQSSILNVSINEILYSAGDYGPMLCTAAYNLPNYEDIRSEFGSKQVIYKFQKSIEETLNPQLFKQFKSKRQLELSKRDPDGELYNDLWDLQVLLHETVGHASGKLYKHTFKEGENLFIGGVKYNIGDVINITDRNYSEFMIKDSSSLEELRAEINALYISLANFDMLAKEGMFKDWLNVFTKQELMNHCIIEMCRHMFRRYYTQGDNFTEIKEAHARANVVITNFILERGGIELLEEIKNIDGHDYHLLDINIVDFQKCFDAVVELLRLVQHIKSTGDYAMCQELFNKYTNGPVNIETARNYKKYITENREKLIGKIKATVRLYFRFQPVLNNEGQLVDANVGHFSDFIEQNLENERLELSLGV